MEPNQPNPQPPTIQQNIGTDTSTLGIVGIARQVGNIAAMALIAGMFIWLFEQHTVQSRQDRIEDRQMFRDSIRDLMQQADRHTGEIKAAMDANTSATLRLSDQLKGMGPEIKDKVRSAITPPEEQD